MPDTDREAVGPMATVESVVLDWEDVHPRLVFGHRAYLRGRHMFGYLVVGGVAIGKLSETDREAFVARGARTDRHGDEEAKGWYRLNVVTDEDVDVVLDFLRRAYEAVA